MVFLIAIILSLAKYITPHNMTGKIVGGEYSELEKFPHMAFLEIECSGYFSCGASILNQRMLLSAAHCFINCRDHDVITAYMGELQHRNGFSSDVDRFKMHEKFSYDTGANDIAVASLTRNLEFSWKIQRVILMKDPPYDGPSFVAGWGLINDHISSQYLKHASQEVWTPAACVKKLHSIATGCFCAQNRFQTSHPSKGDSGGALIIRDYIQIGIVSHENPLSPTLRIYTNATHYYDWIHQNIRRLYCKKQRRHKHDEDHE